MAEFVPIEAEEEQVSSFVPVSAEAPMSETQESTTQEIAEGLASGLLGIPQGLGALAAAGVDIIYDTDY